MLFEACLLHELWVDNCPYRLLFLFYIHSLAGMPAMLRSIVAVNLRLGVDSPRRGPKSHMSFEPEGI